MSHPDPRVNAYRADLADVALSGSVEAVRFTEPSMRQSIRGIAPLLKEPAADAQQVSQIRYGEFLDVFEMREDGFAWVQNRADRYVGYLPAASEFLCEEIADLRNRVSALTTFVYPDPDVRAPPTDELTLGAYVRLTGNEDKFVELASGGYIFSGHVAPAEETLSPDYVFTAGRLLNAPYLWGGRTPKGIDCSGLVQLALDMAGHDCPRDSDQQREAFGGPLPAHWRDVGWRRGDLVFFDGHVGIMTGADHIIHASGQDMKVVVEPLFDVVMRGKDILAYGRPE